MKTNYFKVYLEDNTELIFDKESLELYFKYSWSIDTSGYLQRKLYRGEVKTSKRMHLDLLPSIEGKEVDHINRNRMDNRRENLRYCTRSENCQNTNRFRIGKYRGVYKNGKGWKGQLRKNGKSYLLGNFKTQEEAALAYDKKAIELYGDHAFTNFKYKQG